MFEHNSIHLEKQKEIEQKIEEDEKEDKLREKEKKILPNYFDKLPQILILHIFNWLTLEDLAPSLSVCQRFHKQINNQLLCQKLCLKRWKALQINHPPLLPIDRNWTWLAICLMNSVDEQKLSQIQTPKKLNLRSRDHLYIGEYNQGKKNW